MSVFVPLNTHEHHSQGKTMVEEFFERSGFVEISSGINNISSQIIKYGAVEEFNGKFIERIRNQNLISPQLKLCPRFPKYFLHYLIPTTSPLNQYNIIVEYHLRFESIQAYLPSLQVSRIFCLTEAYERARIINSSLFHLHFFAVFMANDFCSQRCKREDSATP